MSVFESPRKLNSLQDNQSSNSSSCGTVDLLHSSDDDQDDDASIQTEYKEIQCKECHSEQVVDSDEIIYKKHFWFDSVKFPTIDDVTTSNTSSSSSEGRDRTTTATAAVVTHSGKKRRRAENTQEYDLTNQLRLDHFSTPDRNRNGTHQYTLTGNEEDALRETRNGNISSQIQQSNQEAQLENEESNSTIVNDTAVVSTSQPQNRRNKETRQSDDVILESDTEQPTNETRNNHTNSNRNVIELLDSDNEDPPTMSQFSMDRIHNRRKRNRQRNRNHRHRGRIRGSATSYAATAIDVDLTLE